MRLVLKVFLGLFVLLALLLGAGFYWLDSSLPPRPAKITVKSIGEEVNIVRDAHGVPHIFAAHRNDALFALGYVHAQDRLWQMEMIRRAGAGRLSEIFGEATLDFDRRMRVLGLRRKAERALKGLDGDTLKALDAYSAGVNAYLSSDHFVRPPEFIVMRTRPEPWRPVHSILWGKLMTQILSGNWVSEIRHAQAAGKLPRQKLFDLWPHLNGTDIPERWRRALDESGRGDGGDGGGDTEPPVRDRTPDDQAALSSHALRPFGMPGASNAWAVSGRLTRSGRPLLANDPHLGFSAPNLWYLARISTPSFQMTGAGVPGVPFMVLGHNERLAWGMTATMADQEDVYVFEPVSGDAESYRDGNGIVRAFQTRKETINVRGEDAVTLTVRETIAGPVISDVYDLKLDGALIVSLKAAYLEDADTTAQALLKMSEARGLGEFRDALRDFQTPHISILYGDTDGNIAYFAPGRLPIRPDGTGEWPKPWREDTKWRGYLSPDLAAVRINPSDGLIISANDKDAVGDYPYYITDLWEPSYRADRARELLNSHAGVLAPQDLARMHRDVVSRAALDLLPLMTRIEADGQNMQKALKWLRSWDGTMDADRPEPLIFAAWLSTLNHALIQNSLGMESRRFWNQRPRTIKHVLRDRPEWCASLKAPNAPGETTVSSCAELLSETLKDALAGLRKDFGSDMAGWQWGAAHKADFSHQLFGRIPLLDDWANRHVPTDGSTYTLNAGLYDSNSQTPYRNIHGAGLRAIYDFSDLPSSLFMIAMGQSGHPGSPHYDDLLPRWLNGRYITLGQSRESLLNSGAAQTRLVPAGRAEPQNPKTLPE